MGGYYSLWHPGPAVLDGLLGVGPGQDNDGVELGVVELVHGIGRHVQQRVLALVHDVSDGGQSHDTRLASLTGRVELCNEKNILSNQKTILELTRRSKLEREVSEKSFSGDVGHRSKDDDRAGEARVAETDSFVSGELGH